MRQFEGGQAEMLPLRFVQSLTEWLDPTLLRKGSPFKS